MNTIFIINGYPASGKDTFVEMVREELLPRGIPVHNISSIRPVWNMLKSAGIDMDRKGPAERKLAAEVKSALENYDWCVTKRVMEDARASLIGAQHALCFVHMREAAAIKRAIPLGGTHRVMKVLVKRPGAIEDMDNHADTDVMNTTYDIIVNNDSDLTGLRGAAKFFTAKL